jgi:Acyl-coenzyme A:6-aminopenicillanic acid acyl-transferase
MIEAPDYRFFDLRGGHANAGYTLGLADPPFVRQTWWAEPPSHAFALSCRDLLHDLHPPLIDEHDAYADAQHLDRDTLWHWCCRVDLKARMRVGAMTHEDAEGCSTFVWRTPSQHVVVGRNYDYWPLQARRQRLRFTPDCCALPSVGSRGSVPAGRYDGLNSAGLFVSLHVVMTDTPDHAEVRPGVPFHLCGRIALERCHTAREACALLQAVPHLSSINLLLADRHETIVLEIDPRRVRALESDGTPVLAATNHYRHPDMRGLQGRRTFDHSCRRLDRLSRDRDAQPTDSVDALLAYAETEMADRSVPVCGERGAMTTLWSCVAELRSGRIRYAAGLPGHAPFEEFSVAA